MDYVKYIRNKVGHEKIILNASGVIITFGDKILLQHRSDNNEWGLVGGLMEIGETLHDAAIREAKEETGLDIKITEFVGIYHNYNMEWPNKDKAHVICSIFVGQINGGDLRVDSESLELKFFAKDEIPYIASMDHREAINDYFNNIRNKIN